MLYENAASYKAQQEADSDIPAINVYSFVLIPYPQHTRFYYHSHDWFEECSVL